MMKNSQAGRSKKIRGSGNRRWLVTVWREEGGARTEVEAISGLVFDTRRETAAYVGGIIAGYTPGRKANDAHWNRARTAWRMKTDTGFLEVLLRRVQ